jgi:hypothetical protein
MNHFVIKEKVTKNYRYISTDWSKEDIKKIDSWEVVSQHSNRIAAKEAVTILLK